MTAPSATLGGQIIEDGPGRGSWPAGPVENRLDHFDRLALGRQCATVCDMRTVTHREMRNQSGEILRQVANGETVQVTNHGQLVARIMPPDTDVLAELVARGQVRPALRPASSLRAIVRRKSAVGSDAVVADVRGRW